MIFCDYKIFEYFNISDSDVVEDYLIKKVILNIILKPYVNNSKSILDNLISDTKINLNITFKKIFNEKIGQMKNTDKLIYINNYIKDLRQISYPDSLYRSFFVLPELFESSRDGKKHCMDYKKMLVPAKELLRFLELELESLKELIRLGITEEKEEKAETKIESEVKTNPYFQKNKNGIYEQNREFNSAKVFANALYYIGVKKEDVDKKFQNLFKFYSKNKKSKKTQKDENQPVINWNTINDYLSNLTEYNDKYSIREDKHYNKNLIAELNKIFQINGFDFTK